MSNITPVNHRIQKYILDYLRWQKYARFRDIRPPRADTNLVTYHLGVLAKQGLVQKTPQGYTLGAKGLLYVDQVQPSSGSKSGVVGVARPAVIVMIVVQNSDGDVLLQRRTKQPYIDTWTLPYSKPYFDDTSIDMAAIRLMEQELGVSGQVAEPAGDSYIRVFAAGELVSTTLVHVFRLYSDAVVTNEALAWVRPHKLANYELAPAVEEIMTRTFFKDIFYFEEYAIEWEITP